MSQGVLRAALIQMPSGPNPWRNASYLETCLQEAASSEPSLDLAVGVQGGISSGPPLPEMNEMLGYLGDLAAYYGIYLLPGSMRVSSGESRGYLHQVPVFGPHGTLLDRYSRVILSPEEAAEGAVPGGDYCVFDIGQKMTRVGVMLGREADYPEISRSLALCGAEVLVRICADPACPPGEQTCLDTVRAVENQAFFLRVSAVGPGLAGGSAAIDPEAGQICRAGSEAETRTVNLDLQQLRRCRDQGSWGRVRFLGSLLENPPPQPWAGREGHSPLAGRLGKQG